MKCFAVSSSISARHLPVLPACCRQFFGHGLIRARFIQVQYIIEIQDTAQKLYLVLRLRFSKESCQKACLRPKIRISTPERRPFRIRQRSSKYRSRPFSQAARGQKYFIISDSIVWQVFTESSSKKSRYRRKEMFPCGSRSEDSSSSILPLPLP